MKVLLISQAYPPYPVVGAQRARKVAEMFHGRGHDVTVLTERLPDEQDGTRANDLGVTIRTVAAGLPYRLRLVGLRNRLTGRTARLSSWDGPRQPKPAPAQPGVAASRGRRGWTRALKELAIGVLRLPDDQQQFVPPALRAARPLVRAGVDVVYTTAPSFSSHLVGLLIRRRQRVRWIAEFRDPWVLARLPRDVTPRPAVIQRMNRWLEGQCLARADVLVAVTETLGHELAAKLPAEQRGKVVVAMSGIDELTPPRAPASPDAPFRILYTGSFYFDRDPRPFLAGLAAWMQADGLTAAHVRVELAGRCRHYAHVSVEEIVAELGLADVVHFHDWLPHEEIQVMLRTADLVLLIARSQPGLIPNKLFEYLGARAPILAVVDEGGESARILSRVGGQYVVAVDEDAEVTPATMRDQLARAYRARHEPPATDDTALEALLARNQLGALARAIGA